MVMAHRMQEVMTSAHICKTALKPVEPHNAVAAGKIGICLDEIQLRFIVCVAGSTNNLPHLCRYRKKFLVTARLREEVARHGR